MKEFNFLIIGAEIAASTESLSLLN